MAVRKGGGPKGRRDAGARGPRRESGGRDAGGGGARGGASRGPGAAPRGGPRGGFARPRFARDEADADARPPRGGAAGARGPRGFAGRDEARGPRPFGDRDASRGPRKFGGRDAARGPRSFDEEAPPRRGPAPRGRPRDDEAPRGRFTRDRDEAPRGRFGGAPVRRDREDREPRDARGDAGERAQERVRQYPKAPQPKQHQPSPGIEAKLRPRPQFENPAYRAAGKLDGLVALITGGDSGIGRAVAVLYAREGADVAIVYLPEEEEDAVETQRHVEAAGRRCFLLPGDVTESAFCRQAVERTVRELGALDILVNNAAHQKNVKSLEEVTEEQWDLTFRTNIYGYFYMVKAAVPHMKPGSAIINTGSITGLEGSKDLLDYSATKGAIHAFTKSLAQNLVEKQIRVNCVAPGPVWTPLNPQARPAEEVAKFGKDQPMKRPAQPEEVAPAFVFFASSADSSYITGEVLTLLGGETTAG